VTDNGCGIPMDQVRIAFFRHATSKIETAEDLFAIHSLGFRGEALSSIASVGRVEILTRTADSDIGCRYQIEGGVELACEEAAAPLGTSFTVRDLFFNTPVRRSFLKTPQTETSYIVSLMEQLALSRPGIAMSLVTDGRQRLRTNGSYSLKDIIYTLEGRDVAGHLRAVEHEIGEMKVEGFAGEPSINRGNRGGEQFFVNGRSVKSPLLMKAVEQAYHGLTMQHQFPVAVLRITLPPASVDVNVHPNKTEIRFRNEKEVFDLVYRGVRNALFSQDLIPIVEDNQKKTTSSAAKNETVPTAKEETVPTAKEETVPVVNEAQKESLPLPASQTIQKQTDRTESNYPVRQNVLRETGDYRVDADRRLLDRILEQEEKKQLEAAPATLPPDREDSSVSSAEAEKASKPVQADLFEEKIIEPNKEGSFRLIGQVFGTFWLMEVDGWFLMADQHAVHEKILYERTMKALRNKEATSQMLLPPVILTLNGAQQETLTRCQASFESMGFEISSLGGREVRIDAVPDNLFSLSGKDLFLEMLDELGEEKVTAPAMIDEKVALMSCKAAVKGNHVLSFEEAEALLKELLTLDNPYACPHGRPTMIRMSKYELEKKFKRIV